MNSVNGQQINYTMNIIWTSVVVISITILTITSPDKVLIVAVGGIGSAVETSVMLIAVYCFWGGIIAIMQDSALLDRISVLTRGVVTRLFGVSVPSEAISHIAVNMSANIIGVSNASTPSAVKAISIMEQDNTVLSRAGAMLFVINATSIQLLPTTVMGIRASLGSIDATNIVLPTMIATTLTTLLGVMLVNIGYGRAR